MNVTDLLVGELKATWYYANLNRLYEHRDRALD